MSDNELLLEIQQVEFNLVELQLYLDIHPTDEDALKQFNKYSRKLRKLKVVYDKTQGPLLEFGFSKSLNSWKWIKEPWPWQIDNE